MVLTRRRALHALGTAAAASIAGCSSSIIGSDQSTEYRLTVDPIDVSPVEHALYEPGDEPLFGEPARTALSSILPDGRHTTYGYEPLPEDAYVEHESTYFQTKYVVTGRTELDRSLVRLDPVPSEDVPDSARLVDSFERPTARVLKILHSHAQTDGEGGSSDLLREDAYVLRRPAERESRLGTGDLDGDVVTMTDTGTWAYRVRSSRERITEPANTVLAVEVADSRSAFREVVFADRIDVELAPTALPAESRQLLEDAIARDVYRESAPRSDTFERLLEALEVANVETAVTGRLLWYDDGYYRYALYRNEVS